MSQSAFDEFLAALEACGVDVIHVGGFEGEPVEFIIMKFPNGRVYRLEASAPLKNPAWLTVWLDSEDR